MAAEKFRARKGLEAYNQFVCGWVKEVVTRRIVRKFVAIGRVSGNIANLHCFQLLYSQRLSDAPFIEVLGYHRRRW